MKLFNQINNVGRAKYTVNFYDGVKQHNDGSPFYDLRIFSNKVNRDRFIISLIAEGYIEQ